MVRLSHRLARGTINAASQPKSDAVARWRINAHGSSYSCCFHLVKKAQLNRKQAFSLNRPWAFLVLVVLVAAGLRFFHIGSQSFWNDEGNSARLAERSIDLIIDGARGDIHPPGYYLALHYWRAVFGESEAALRSLSALAGVSLVIVTFLAARRLFADVVVGQVAAALVAINPFLVYFGQEARMYSLLALWAMALTWALLVWWQQGSQSVRARPWPLALYALFAVAGLYTHYAFAFVMLAQGLTVGLWVLDSRTSPKPLHRLSSLVVAYLAVVVLYLPWLPTAWRHVTTWSSPRGTYGLPEALNEIWRLLNFGQTTPTYVVTGGLVAAGALVLLSLLPPVDSPGSNLNGLSYRLRWGLLAMLILLPIGLILGLGLYRAAYLKFLLVAVAPLSILLARGFVGGWRIANGISVWGEREPTVGYGAVMFLFAALFLFDTGRSLNNLYFDTAYARADYGAIAQHVEENARPGDAVLLNAPNQWEVFTYYHPDDSHVFPLARDRPLNKAANEAELRRIVADHQRLSAIFWGDAESDPERFIESWLETHTYKAGETWYGDVRLAVYAVPAKVAETPAVSLDARFGTVIRLDGFAVLQKVVGPGDIVQLTLFWRAAERVPERYKVFVHLYNDAGELVAQTDSEPGATLRPTNTWAPGERITDRYGVFIPSDAPEGVYALTVGLYDLTDPRNRLAVTQGGDLLGDSLNLSEIVVASKPAPNH